MECLFRVTGGKAVYGHIFDMPARASKESAEIMLDLGRVEDAGVARVMLNSRNLGVVWTTRGLEISELRRPWPGKAVEANYGLIVANRGFDSLLP